MSRSVQNCPLWQIFQLLILHHYILPLDSYGFGPGLGIENGAVHVVDEVRGYQLLVRVGEDTLHVRLTGLKNNDSARNPKRMREVMD